MRGIRGSVGTADNGRGIRTVAAANVERGRRRQSWINRGIIRIFSINVNVKHLNGGTHVPFSIISTEFQTVVSCFMANKNRITFVKKDRLAG